MHARILRFGFAALVAGAIQAAAAQAQSVQAPPPMIPIVGTLVDASGQPLTAQTTVTIAIYGEQTDGVPIWQESQQVTPDARGRYSIVLGSTTVEGLPVALFAGSEARWLGIQADGLLEQPRILLTSVAYALKSGDANTLGGLPASAFVLSGSSTTTTARRTNERTDGASGARAAKAAASASASDPTTGPGTEDQVIPDDLIVQGSACVGFDCVLSESFGFDSLRIKENNTRIQFDDTSATAGFSTNNWQIRANSSASGGGSFLAFVDQGATGNSETGTIVFEVDAGAPANALKVGSSGKVGIRTASPQLDIHMNTGDTPAVRFEQNNSTGFTAQTWDVAGNEANFFVRDVTGGSRLPFRIRPGAPTSSIDISASGNVGIGTTSPGSPLTVSSAQPQAIRIVDTSGTLAPYLAGYSGTTGGTRYGFLQFTSAASSLSASTGSLNIYAGNESAVRMFVESDGNVGIGTTTPANPLQMGSGAYVSAGGVWTNASSRMLKDRITDLPASRAMDAFERLKPVTFVYKANPTEAHVGFIAEDVPDLVATTDRKSLAAMDIVAVLAKVAQEQQATIADLKARVARLEVQLAQAAAEVTK